MLKDLDNQLDTGLLSCEQIYINNNKDEDDPNRIISLKTVHNRKQSNQSIKATKSNQPNTNKLKETETLIKIVQSKGYVRSVKFQEESYIAINYKDYMLDDMVRFCVNGDSILNVDTTFNIVPGLWLTDTSYKHLGLIDAHGKNPEFPGPSMWHFKKDRQEFRNFAMELVTASGELKDLRRVGHDLDKATALGFKDVFSNAEHAWCTQHLQGRTAKKLQEMGVGQRNTNCIMSDLYGTQSGFLQQHGLADSLDTDDFQAKLASLKEQWEEIAPSFYTWFRRYQEETFTSCLVMSARSSYGVTTRYYNNGLENIHKSLKKKINESKQVSDLEEINKSLDKWISENYIQEINLAIRGLGKYRLAPGYQHLSVDSILWARLSAETKEKKINQFFKYQAQPSDNYQKPANAGKKGKQPTKRRGSTEPELFVDRVQATTLKMKIRKETTSVEDTWEVNCLLISH